MGRRAIKKVTTNGTLTEHRRFLYRGYLQIDSPPPHRRLTPAGQSRFAHCPTGLTAVVRLACCDLTRAYTPALWFITWESPRRLGGGLDKHEVFAPKGRAGNGVPASQPTQPTATRPLAIQKNGTWYTYGWDLTKNICETYRTDGRIDLAYTYTPYGYVSPAHAYDQPLRWSSEYHDTELGLVYYNYRHYNPTMGRWISRDPMGEVAGALLLKFGLNNPLISHDERGLFVTIKRSVEDCTITVIHNIVLYSSEQYTVDLLKLEEISMLITSSIEIYWNGFMKDCCTVIFAPNVSILPYKPSWFRRWSSLASYIEITNETSYTSFVTNGKNGTWWAEADPWVYAHESGHIAGLPDDYVNQYTVDPKTNKITRVSVPKKGHEKHMMGAYLGRAQQHEVDKILEGVTCPCNNKKS